MSNPLKANTALEEFILSIEQIGSERTTHALINERKIYALLNNADAKFVLTIVARAFKIPELEILQGVGRKNDRRDAIGFCAYYLHYELKHDMQLVRHMLHKSEWVLYKYAKLIKNLKPDRQGDRKYLAWKAKFDAELIRSGILKK